MADTRENRIDEEKWTAKSSSENISQLGANRNNYNFLYIPYFIPEERNTKLKKKNFTITAKPKSR